MTQSDSGPPANKVDQSLVATNARIIEQMKRVRSMEPGSPAHRVASKVLLLLQDSLFVLTEARELIIKERTAAARKSSAA